MFDSWLLNISGQEGNLHLGPGLGKTDLPFGRIPNPETREMLAQQLCGLKSSVTLGKVWSVRVYTWVSACVYVSVCMCVRVCLHVCTCASGHLWGRDLRPRQHFSSGWLWSSQPVVSLAPCLAVVPQGWWLWQWLLNFMSITTLVCSILTLFSVDYTERQFKMKLFLFLCYFLPHTQPYVIWITMRQREPVFTLNFKSSCWSL